MRHHYQPYRSQMNHEKAWEMIAHQQIKQHRGNGHTIRSLPELNQEIENLTISISNKETKSVITSFLTKKIPESECFIFTPAHHLKN